MNWFYNLKIAAKLQVSFGLLAAIAGLIGWMGIMGVREVADRSSGMYLNQLMPIHDLSYANAAVLNARTDVRNMLLARDRSKRNSFVETINAETAQADEYLAKFRKLDLDKDERELFTNFETSYGKYLSFRARVIDLSLAGKDDDALELANGEARSALSAARKNLDALIGLKTEHAKAANNENDVTAQSARTKVLAYLGFGILPSFGLGLLLSRAIGRPLSMMHTAAEK